ncbi:MAG TPA: hypothetical protein VH277_05690 [Gemmatimonadaceae bacterium]|nr:hypothetical protein [Gemmatimonadaceae bacterium]
MSALLAHRTPPLLLLATAALLGACSNGSDSPTSPSGPSLSIVSCAATGTVQLASAQSARVDCSNGGTGVTVAGGGASYLIVPQLPVSLVPLTFVSYQLRAGAGVAASLAPSASITATTGGALAADGISSRLSVNQLAFDAAMRAHARASIQHGRFTRSSAESMRPARTVTVAPPPAVGSVRSFRVLADTSGTRFTTVGARLAFAGASLLLYVDTLAPANGFGASQLQAFGQLFDQTLYPIDTAAFGPPSDVDQNGRVIMLMTPRVNALTSTAECQASGFIGGFFEEEDLGGPATDPNSNHAEIFYSIVPDPTGTSSCAHTAADVGFSVPATFLHELQHLISFSQHYVVHQSDPEEGWLDEGLSIVAEEQGSVYYEQKCPGTACRTNPTQLFPDSSQGFISGFLLDSYFYALRPDTASVTLHSDSDDGFSWRGGDWLLMRWIGDQFGSAAYRRLDENSLTGVANIESSTGQAFPALFANFGVSLYTDSLPGFARTTAPPANRFVTRNVRQLWARLFATSGGNPEIPLAFPLPVRTLTSDSTTFRMFPGSNVYYRLNTATTATTVSIQFSAPGGAALPSVYKPQLAIFRLPPGA